MAAARDEPVALQAAEERGHRGLGDRLVGGQRGDALRPAVAQDCVVSAAMQDDDDDRLEELGSPKLHDLAVSHAKRHLDLRFFWELMRILPAAEAAAGELDEANADIQRMSAHVDDVTDAGRGEVAEQLRPFYLEYLRKHDVAPR